MSTNSYWWGGRVFLSSDELKEVTNIMATTKGVSDTISSIAALIPNGASITPVLSIAGGILGIGVSLLKQCG